MSRNDSLHAANSELHTQLTSTRKVSVKGQATFTWIETGQSWDETFTYSLDFDHESKVTDYQVWADSGAAYLARIGKLNEVRESKVNIWSHCDISCKAYTITKVTGSNRFLPKFLG